MAAATQETVKPSVREKLEQANGPGKRRRQHEPEEDQGSREFLDSIAVGESGEGKRLYLVSLKGHKSRVIHPTRGNTLMVEQLPVWARNEGEARTYFEDEHHIGLQSDHRITVEAA